ncbi:MAG: hypothetical protein WCG91_01515 [Candidatus Shapirobacteria bacterium]
MEQNNYKLSSIGKIDNRTKILSWSTTLILLILIVVIVWFARGGSIRFYASLYFGLYDLTSLSWLSIVLVGVAQTIIFLPFRFISARLHPDLKEFENEIDRTKTDNQYILFQEKIKQGKSSVLFYMFNFIMLGIAFFSVGRFFFLDFYNHKIDPKYLYHFIPYPTYPIKGTIFNFPFIKITETIALNWKTIFSFWVIVLIVLFALRLLWKILRKFLTKNKSILNFRISYNKILIFVGSFTGTLFIFSLFFLRHIPSSFEIITLSADLAKQNIGFNIITALGSFLAAVFSGFKYQREASKEARLSGIPENIISKVFKTNMGITLRNGVFLALFALWITRLMPCSHDLSVITFIVLSLTSPLTVDLLIKKVNKKHV